MTYIGYPIACIILAYIIGNIGGSGKLDRLYQNIISKKVYAGYSSKDYKSIYKDDIDNYVGSSEILIGRNVNNLKKRNEISTLEKKYFGYLKKEILILIATSVIVVLMGMFI